MAKRDIKALITRYLEVSLDGNLGHRRICTTSHIANSVDCASSTALRHLRKLKAEGVIHQTGWDAWVMTTDEDREYRAAKKAEGPRRNRAEERLAELCGIDRHGLLLVDVDDLEALVEAIEKGAK